MALLSFFSAKKSNFIQLDSVLHVVVLLFWFLRIIFFWSVIYTHKRTQDWRTKLEEGWIAVSSFALAV